MSLSNDTQISCGFAGCQKLLAVWGQVQTYMFEIEMLKRCDPTIATRFVCALKANALMTRYLIRYLRDGFLLQKKCKLTPLTFSVWSTLLAAKKEGERLISCIEKYSNHKNAKLFFADTMKLSEPCNYHVDVELEIYGGKVTSTIKFLHDVENLLKQLNYCHLIISSESAVSFLEKIETFLERTTGHGGIVPQEIFDPCHPCSVCFEELCVTANRGESAHKRVVGKMCDHVTKEIRLRILRDELISYLPHATHIDKSKRDAARAALEKLNTRSEHERSTNPTNSVQDAADAALDEHNVFIPASGKLYAVSELKFWLASSGGRTTSSMSRTVDTFSDNLRILESRERQFDIQTAIIELAIFDRRMEHFERVYMKELDSLSTIDRILLGGRSCSPDDTIEALIKACYDHHLSQPLLRRLANPEKVAEDALRNILLEGVTELQESSAKRRIEQHTGNPRIMTNAPANQKYDNNLNEMSRIDGDIGNLRRQYNMSDCWEQDNDTNIFHSSTNAEKSCSHIFHDNSRLLELPDRVLEHTNDEGWIQLVAAANLDLAKRKKMYADRLTKRSIAALDRCVTEQRKELEKALRVNVYGQVLNDTFVRVHNAFMARLSLSHIQKSFIEICGSNYTDNRTMDQSFDAHRFILSSLLRQRVDPAILPSLTHKFFQLVNGPLFDHDRHTFAQPPNTALYFSVENVGLLPHLKEELARFMLNHNRGYGPNGGTTGSDWVVSRYRGFYDFSEVEGITAAQRLAWKYLRELILATALFSSVFHCGEVRVLRADDVRVDSNGARIWQDGVYVTYEPKYPLIAIFGTSPSGHICPETSIIVDSDIFSLLYSVLQKMAPRVADRMVSKGDRCANSEKL